MKSPLAMWRAVPVRARRWSLGLAGGFVLYLVAGFFVVPAVVKSQLLSRLPALTKRHVAVREVRFNPLELSLTVRGLALTETNGAAFASFEAFHANFQLASLFKWAWTFAEISLDAPRVEVVLNRDGSFNFDNLLEASNTVPKEAGKPVSIPPVLVYNLGITNGHIGFSDFSLKTPFRAAYAPIQLHFDRFTTRPNVTTPYSFEASSEGGNTVAWSGSVTAQPLASSGTFRIAGVPLPRHVPYLEAFTRARLVGGALDAGGGYRFALGTNGMDLSVSNLAVTVSGIRLQDPDTREIVLGLPSCELRDGRFDWRGRNARVGSVVVAEPSSLVRRRADGSLNLLSLLVPQTARSSTRTNPAAAPSGAAEPPWVLAIDDYRLEQGTVQLEDATVAGPFRATLRPVSLRLRHFSTATNADAAIALEVVTEAGEKVNLDTAFCLDPVRARGSLKLAALELKKYQPYLSAFFRGGLASGQSDVALEFSGSLPDGQPAVIVTNASVRVADLRVQSPDRSETWVTVPSFDVERASASLADRSVQVGLIESSGAAVVARRETNGTVNLLALLPSPGQAAATNVPEATAPPPEPAGAGWRVSLDDLALRDVALDLEDRALPRPGRVRVDQASLAVHGARFPSNAPVRVEADARVNATGQVGARATVWPYTPAADATVSVAGFDLRGLQPWVDGLANLGIEHGGLTTTGRVHFGSPDGSGPKLRFAGDLAITNFLAADRPLSREFLRWDDFSLKGIDVELQPNKAAVGQARFAGLKASVVLGPDGRPNLLAILPGATNAPGLASPAPAAVPPTAGPAPVPFPVELGELKLEQAALHFGDQSVQPPCAFDLQRIDASVRGLSSRPGSTAHVDIRGYLDEASPFGVGGTVSPLASELALDLTVTNQNLQLTPFTPYMEKYAGYPLNKGRLSVNLSYAVADRKLVARNEVRIDQLMLGARNDSPDATALPVKLAIALLKDRHGGIQLDVPVEGRLDDPQFSVGPIILKVLGNVITKAAASPFKLLGSLVGGGEEMSYVDFQPGLAGFLENETNKLDKLAKALEQRPSLNLEIAAFADPVADRDALARALVRQAMEKRRQEELAAAGSAATNGLALEPAEYERLLRAAVVQTFGADLDVAIRDLASRIATNQAVAPRPPPPKRTGFFGRVRNVFRPSRERALAAQARRQAKADAALLKQNPGIAQLSATQMVALLAAKTEVPADALRQLMQERAQAVQAYLLQTGKVTAERLFLVAPKAPEPTARGAARVELSVS